MIEGVVLVDGARTPVGRFGGALRASGAVELGGLAARAAVERSGLAATDVESVIVGHARQAGNGPNAGRLVAHAAGIPKTAPALTVQQACLSGIQAVIGAAKDIQLGEAQTVLAVGTEHMSSIPYLSFGTRWGARMGDTTLVDGLYRDGFIDPMTGCHMGELTDDLARRRGITREAQDTYALESQRGAGRGQREGFFARMIVPVEVPGERGGSTTVVEDEHPRPDTSLEQLAKLKPAFRRDGAITPGNASGITDGAAAVVVMAEDAAAQRGLQPLARVRSYAVAAVEPADFAVAPVPAMRSAVERAGLDFDDLDLVELNEAFAAQMLACLGETGIPRERVNVYGGAIALGHPIGMSGVRVVLTLMHALAAQGGRYGLAAICGNGGHGAALVLERYP